MIRAVLGILGLGMTLTVTQVQAAVVAPDSAFATFYSRVTAPGKQTIGFGSNGTPVVAPGVPSVSSAGGPVQVARTGSLPLPAGARLPVTGTAKIPNSAVAAIIKKALPLVPYLATGVALFELGRELGFYLGQNADGTVTVAKDDPSVCSVAPCPEFGIVTQAGTVWASSPDASCNASLSNIAAEYGSGNHAVFVSANIAACYAKVYNAGGSYLGQAEMIFVKRTVAPRPSSVPSSEQEFLDAIAAKSGWPSGSAVAQALVDAQKVTGDQIPTDQPNATGPATVAGPTEKTKVGPKETTKQSNYNCTYYDGPTVMEGGSVVCTEKTTTTEKVTTTDPATGTTTDTTTTAEENEKPAEIPKDEEQGQAVDSALPGQPTLYKRQYPDGLTGVWNTKKAELLATPLLQLTSNLQPTIAASGGYPTWPVPVVIGHWNFGTYDVSPASYVWDFLKVCTIIGALFLARALIFGG